MYFLCSLLIFFTLQDLLLCLNHVCQNCSKCTDEYCTTTFSLTNIVYDNILTEFRYMDRNKIPSVDLQKSILKLRELTTELGLKSLFPDEKIWVDVPIKVKMNRRYSNEIEELLHVLKEYQKRNVTGLKEKWDVLYKAYFGDIDDEIIPVKYDEITDRMGSPGSFKEKLDKEILKQRYTAPSFLPPPNKVIQEVELVANKSLEELYRLRRRNADELRQQVKLRNYATKEVEQFLTLTYEYLTEGKVASPVLTNIIDRKFRWEDSLLRGHSTFIPVPYDFIIPGERFKEFYYWDSYYVLRGFASAGKTNVILDIVKNYFSMIDRYGFIPNGARQYYLDRSQPPLFAESVAAVYDYLVEFNYKNESVDFLIQALPRLLTEYLSYWMNPYTGHVVLTNGTVAAPLPSNLTTTKHLLDVMKRDKLVLNRYYSALTVPRPESYSKDADILEKINVEKTPGNSKENLMRSIRAAAESGWDFSSRWQRDYIEGKQQEGQEPTTPLSEIEFFNKLDTISVLPVDLNSILYSTELIIQDFITHFSQTLPAAIELAKTFGELAASRYTAMNKTMLGSDNVYYDYDLRTKKQSKVLSAASSFASSVFNLKTPLPDALKDVGGCKATQNVTQQQWDAPNAWAPFQRFISRQEKFQWKPTDEAYSTVASRLGQASPFVKSVSKAALQISRKPNDQQKGFFFEKYDATEVGKSGGGGEYPVQYGFGWTNGFMVEMMSRGLW